MAGRKKDDINGREAALDTEGIRLNKYLGDSGLCSRREADRLIAAGKVWVNGTPAGVGSRIYPGDRVVCGEKEITKEEKLVLIAFHKPRGIECTTDRRVKENVIDYLNYGSRIFPIGRLDKDSEGLLLMTNDGDIVNKILRARNYHEKEYLVTVNKPVTQEFLKGMSRGVPILGTVTRPCRTEAVDSNTFRIILTQGLNRQIRRMCEYFGYRVQRLVRVRIMNISLGHLKCGGWRNVTDQELAQLKKMLEGSVKTAPPEKAPADGTISAGRSSVEKMPVKGSQGKDKRAAHPGERRGRPRR